jgi:Ca-activated chloride channel family protein
MTSRARLPFRLLSSGLLLVAGPLAAQTTTPAEDPAQATATLKVGATIVSVSAIARDKTGRPVPDLTRDSFVLKQDGKPQPIAYFSQGSDLPLTLALMVDTSGSQRAFIASEIAAGRAFFPAIMTRPEDRAVLVQFDSSILQLAKITSSVPTLEHALAYLSQSHDDIARPGRGGTLLYDAICAVAKIELSAQRGRRAMVLLTDGGDNGSRFSEKNAIAEAQRADIMIYSVFYSNGDGDIDTLRHLSKATGGRVFIVSPELTLQQIYLQIAEDMRLQYQLGYRPPPSKPGKYHKIDLTVTDKALSVQAREGYFTPN